jgi:UDP-N-acetylglucosamine 4-epimerase
VANAVLANDLALFTQNEEAINQVYNTACGDQVTLNEMVEMLEGISQKKVKVTYGPERAGDVKHSRADISKIEKHLAYQPKRRFEEGLGEVYNWYKSQL